MKVKDILESVCLYLDLTDEFQPLFDNTQPSSEVLTEYKKLILAINSVVQELSYKVLRLKTKEDVLFINNTFDINLLSKKMFNIVEIKSNNKKLKFEVLDNKIFCNTSNAQITYNYLPNLVSSLEDEVSVDSRLSLKAFIFGVIAEYNNINGLFEDAQVYNNKFLDAIKECKKLNKNFCLPKRRWF